MGMRNAADKAFDELILRHEKMMYRVAYIYMKNEHDALDVVQEACCRAYRAFGKLKNPEYGGSWLVRITMNCALDALRRIKRRPQLPLEEERTEDIEAASCEESVITQVTVRQLMDALEEDEKQVLLMKYLCELTFAEMAAELARPVGSVKSTLYRALAKLRKKAEEESIT